MNKFLGLFCIIAFFLLLNPSVCFAKRTFLEKEYQQFYCDKMNGETEVVMPDKTRCDCLTDDYAFEFDFVDHWAESVGQSLLYSVFTGKPPAIVLISENPEKDEKYIKRLEIVIHENCLRIKLIVIDINQFRKDKALADKILIEETIMK